MRPMRNRDEAGGGGLGRERPSKAMHRLVCLACLALSSRGLHPHLAKPALPADFRMLPITTDTTSRLGQRLILAKARARPCG